MRSPIPRYAYRVCVTLRDTLSYNFGITLPMARIPTILALIATRFEQEIRTVGTHHDLVELSSNEFVSVHFVYFTRSHANGALTSEFTCIDGAAANVLFDYKKEQQEKGGLRQKIQPNEM